MTTTIEELADAILRASGSSLKNYTTPATRQKILIAAAAVFDAGYASGWADFGALMLEQMPQTTRPVLEKKA